MNEFGEYLKSVRTQKKLTLRELANRSGLSYSFIGALERGKFKPSRETIKSLSESLNEPYENLSLLAGYLPEGVKAQLNGVETTNSAERTFELLEEKAAEMGLSLSDPEFQKLLTKAIDLLRLARSEDD